MIALANRANPFDFRVSLVRNTLKGTSGTDKIFGTQKAFVLGPGL